MVKKGKMMEMPKTGGPSLGLLLLPAAALLVGMGLMAGYVVRRRSVKVLSVATALRGRVS